MSETYTHVITVEFVLDEMDDYNPYMSAEILAEMLYPEYGDTFEIIGAKHV
jgi:hypothetical protein